MENLPAPTTGPLLDTFGRVADDLRISVTDRCNFRCTYCMPAEGLRWLPRDELLTFEEMTRLLALFVRLGVKALKVTGGEPTIRADLPTLVRMFREVGPDLDISITTNGMLLDTLAGPLAAAGHRPRDGVLRLAAAPPVPGDDPARRARQGPGRAARRRGSRPDPDQDQHRRDRRNERRRGRRLRALGARDGLRGAVHRVHAAGRAARLGTRQGRAGRADPRGDRATRTRSRADGPDAEPATTLRLRRWRARARSA